MLEVEMEVKRRLYDARSTMLAGKVEGERRTREGHAGARKGEHHVRKTC
jgi:hypothetical protein